MRINVPALSSDAPLRAALLAAAVSLGGCGNGPSISGPSWNLTGSRTSVAPSPSTSITQPPKKTEPVYRGGRDPVTGRAEPEAPAPAKVAALAPPTQLPAQAPALAAAPKLVQPPSHATPPPPTTAAAPTPTPTLTPVAAATTALAPVAVMKPAGRPQVVEVKQGDSLARIASEYKVSIASLMHANKLRDPYIAPGQWLVLPKR